MLEIGAVMPLAERLYRKRCGVSTKREGTAYSLRHSAQIRGTIAPGMAASVALANTVGWVAAVCINLRRIGGVC